MEKTERVYNFSCPSCHNLVHFHDEAYLCLNCEVGSFEVEEGIPVFTPAQISEEAAFQQEHYDKIASTYVENLGYPHTKTYMSYLDDCLLNLLPKNELGRIAELCCGKGEAITLLNGKYSTAVGIDISLKMLLSSPFKGTSENIIFAQGDATSLPLQEGSFDHVVMLGGIHHINQREALFREVNRILKPGGYFIFREPVDDFPIWRFIRMLIYRISPMLDHQTEQPLRYRKTRKEIEEAGMALLNWKTFGFFGFCIFMNSDVLFFNRFFRFVPFIEKITKISAWIDHQLTDNKYMEKNGLIVVGISQKPIK